MHLAQTDLLQSEYFVFVKSVKEIHCSETEKHQCKGSAKTVNIIHCAHYNPYQILLLCGQDSAEMVRRSQAEAPFQHCPDRIIVNLVGFVFV